MSDLPDPLTPPDCDLRDFPFMPLDIVRLMRSEAWAMARKHPELGFYMVNLWMAAWHEVPAGSLPNDEQAIAYLGAIAYQRWTYRRPIVLRGWVLCSDGRLYHPVVCEKANEAWQRKLRRRQQTELARAERAKKTSKINGSGDPPPSVTETVTEAVTESVTDPVTEPVTVIVTDPPRPTNGALLQPLLQAPRDRDRDRDKEEEEKKEISLTTFARPISLKSDTLEFETFWRAYPRKEGKGRARPAFAKALRITTLGAMVSAIANQRRAGCLRDPQFTPLPASWLNGERWADAIETVDPIARAMGFTEADQANFVPLQPWKGTTH